jgi:hypothetical protein
MFSSTLVIGFIQLNQLMRFSISVKFCHFIKGALAIAANGVPCFCHHRIDTFLMDNSIIMPRITGVIIIFSLTFALLSRQ